MMKMTKAEHRAHEISLKRSDIMKDAHRVARIIVNLVGNYQIALSFALKFVYAYNAKKAAVWATKDVVKIHEFRSLEGAAVDHFTPEYVHGVPVWAIKNDFSRSGAEDVIFYTIHFETLKETEKAVQVEFDTQNPYENGFIDHSKTWVAKSIMA